MSDNIKRAYELLVASKKLIDENWQAQEMIVFFDGVECDGGCLSEDIGSLLDSMHYYKDDHRTEK